MWRNNQARQKPHLSIPQRTALGGHRAVRNLMDFATSQVRVWSWPNSTSIMDRQRPSVYTYIGHSSSARKVNIVPRSALLIGRCRLPGGLDCDFVSQTRPCRCWMINVFIFIQISSKTHILMSTLCTYSIGGRWWSNLPPGPGPRYSRKTLYYYTRLFTPGVEKLNEAGIVPRLVKGRVCLTRHFPSRQGMAITRACWQGSSSRCGSEIGCDIPT